MGLLCLNMYPIIAHTYIPITVEYVAKQIELYIETMAVVYNARKHQHDFSVRLWFFYYLEQQLYPHSICEEFNLSF